VVALLLGAQACDPLPTGRPVGVSGSPADVVVHVRACPGDEVEELSVRLDGNSIIGDDEDLLVWSGAPTTALETVDVSMSDPGEAFALSRSELPLDPERTYFALARFRSAVDAFVKFSPDELSTDRITDGEGDVLTFDDFDASALESC
jgi:hypothetical protein